MANPNKSAYDAFMYALGQTVVPTKETLLQVNNILIGKGGVDLTDEEYNNLDEVADALSHQFTKLTKAVSKHHLVDLNNKEPEAVDLGLPSGRKWASFNVGAESPEDPGLYFDFDEANSIQFKDGWHVPTKEDMIELNENCDSEWTKENGVNGRRFTSRINGNSIFFPAAGYRLGTGLGYRGSYGNFWSSSLYSSAIGYYLSFYSGGVGPAYSNDRFYGFSVRAVQ